jgi:hypothetical protein
MAGSEPKPIAGSKYNEDLHRNPGIGQSKGAYATGEQPEEIEGDNTVEGDVENDTDPAGRVDADRLGRTNE